MFSSLKQLFLSEMAARKTSSSSSTTSPGSPSPAFLWAKAVTSRFNKMFHNRKCRNFSLSFALSLSLTPSRPICRWVVALHVLETWTKREMWKKKKNFLKQSILLKWQPVGGWGVWCNININKYIYVYSHMTPYPHRYCIYVCVCACVHVSGCIHTPKHSALNHPFTLYIS